VGRGGGMAVSKMMEVGKSMWFRCVCAGGGRGAPSPSYLTHT